MPSERIQTQLSICRCQWKEGVHSYMMIEVWNSQLHGEAHQLSARQLLMSDLYPLITATSAVHCQSLRPKNRSGGETLGCAPSHILGQDDWVRSADDTLKKNVVWNALRKVTAPIFT